MANSYNPRAKRVLNEYGEFVPFKEDLKKSEEALEASGQSREEMEMERKLKRQKYRGRDDKDLAEALSVEELEALIAKKKGIKKAPKSVASSDNSQKSNSARKKLDRTLADASKDQDSDDSDAASVDIHALTLPELKAHAKELGVPFPVSVKKAKLIELLEGPSGSSSEKLDRSSDDEDEL